MQNQLAAAMAVGAIKGLVWQRQKAFASLPLGL
jgi:hypothetical protein